MSEYKTYTDIPYKYAKQLTDWKILAGIPDTPYLIIDSVLNNG